MDGELRSEENEDAAVGTITTRIGAYNAAVEVVEEATSEIMVLWGLQQPMSRRQNAFVRHASQTLVIDACGQKLTILQSPSSMGTPGVTGAVMWDSGIVLGKFLEHAVDSGRLLLQGRRVVELGAGCGLVGCIAAILGADVVLTDLPDRLRLLKKNVSLNVEGGTARGSAKVCEITWGDELDDEFIKPPPDIILGSDVVYSEGAVEDLLSTLKQLCGDHTTIFLAGELRNDAVLEYFLEAAMQEFLVGRIDQGQWHPDYSPGSHDAHQTIIFEIVGACGKHTFEMHMAYIGSQVVACKSHKLKAGWHDPRNMSFYVIRSHEKYP